MFEKVMNAAPVIVFWIMLLLGAGLLATCLTGCLSRSYYYEPTAMTISTGSDGLKRGAVKEEGYYPWWSDAPYKSFLNPSFSFVGKNIKADEKEGE